MSSSEFVLLVNPFCVSCSRAGHGCWRALDRVCASYLSVHAASPAEAHQEATGALTAHRRYDCRPLSHPVSRFRPEDDELDVAWRKARTA